MLSMDIMDIINNFINEKELEAKDNITTIIKEINTGKNITNVAKQFKLSVEELQELLVRQGYQYDNNYKLWLKNIETENQAVIKDEKSNVIIPLNVLESIPNLLYNGFSLYSISERYNIDVSDINNTLKIHGYKKRWSYTKKGSALGFNKEILSILHELNTKKKSLDAVGISLGNTVDEIKKILKQEKFEKIWVLETDIRENTTIADIDNTLIVRDLDTGVLNYIYSNHIRLFSIYHINTLLGINSSYYFDRFKTSFKENIHFIQFSKEKIRRIINGIPVLHYLENTALFTETGIRRFAELTKNEDKLSTEDYKKLVNGVSANSINNVENKSATSKGDGDMNPQIKLNHSNKKLKYSNFFGRWIEGGEEALLEEIYIKLNNGQTLYDLSKDYVNSRKDRAPFASQLQFKLEDSGYEYNQKSKKWVYSSNLKANKVLRANEPGANTKPSNSKINDKQLKANVNRPAENAINIKEVVSLINNGETFRVVEQKFNVSNHNLRLLLKNEGYKYDGLFRLWTTKSRDELLEEIENDLRQGKITISDLEKKEVNVKLIKEKIGYESFNSDTPGVSQKNQEIGTVPQKLVNEVDQMEMDLSSDDISDLKLMLHEWKEEKRIKTETSSNSIEEKEFFMLPSSMLNTLEDHSKKTGISKSVIVQEALTRFFNKIN
jgi:hypothetical protein